MIRVIKWLSQVGCSHNDIRRFNGAHMWVECMKCGRESEGIRTRTAALVQSEAAPHSASDVSLRTAA
jgi:hypothetical protein